MNFRFVGVMAGASGGHDPIGAGGSAPPDPQSQASVLMHIGTQEGQAVLNRILQHPYDAEWYIALDAQNVTNNSGEVRGAIGDYKCPQCSHWKGNKGSGSLKCFSCRRHYHLSCAGFDKRPGTVKQIRDHNVVFFCKVCTEKERAHQIRMYSSDQIIKASEVISGRILEQTHVAHTELKRQHDHLINRMMAMGQENAELKAQREQFQQLATRNEQLEQRINDLTASIAQRDSQQATTSKKRRRSGRPSANPEKDDEEDEDDIAEVRPDLNNIEALTAAMTASVVAALEPRLKAFETALLAIKRSEPIVVPSSQPAPFNTNRNIARARSVTRSQPANQQQSKIASLSFAQVVASAKIKTSQIRNIQFNEGQEERCQRILADTGHALGARILSSKKRGKNFLTIKCASPEDAVALEQQVAAKLNGYATVESVTERRPQIKITNIPVTITSENIIQELCEQNAWINTNLNPECIDLYEVTAAKRPYKNAIIACDLALHAKFIEKKWVILGFAERRCHEHINILQCRNCHRFGHSAKHCQYQTRCTKCAGTHAADECTAEGVSQRCFNCMQRNKIDGTTFPIAHRFNDVKCACRIERIAQLKEFMSKN